MGATVAVKNKSMLYIPDLTKGNRNSLKFNRIRVLSDRLELRNSESHLVSVMQGDLVGLSTYLDENYIYAGLV